MARMTIIDPGLHETLVDVLTLAGGPACLRSLAAATQRSKVHVHRALRQLKRAGRVGMTPRRPWRVLP